MTATPFRDRLTTPPLRDLGSYLVELAWSTTSEADVLLANEVVDLFAGALVQNYLA